MFLKVKEALMNCMKRMTLISAFMIVVFLGSSLHCSEQNSLDDRFNDAHVVDNNAEIFCDHLLTCILAVKAIENNSVERGSSFESEGNIPEYRKMSGPITIPINRRPVANRVVPISPKIKKSILEKCVPCLSAD
jgi:hypothetical protein